MRDFSTRAEVKIAGMMPLTWVRRIATRLSRRPPRPRGSRGTGYDFERLAEGFLTREGYRILERNFRTHTGEIDFIGEEKGTLCFIEVKGRRSDLFGPAAEAVTVEKQRRIFRAAEAYLMRRRGARARCRFDVVTIDEPGGDRSVSLLRDAFQGPIARRVRR